MNWFSSRYKKGAIALIPAIVLIFIILGLFRVLWDWSGELSRLISSNILWQLLFMAGFLISPFLMGLLISWKWLRDAALKIFSRVPLVSFFVDLFFNNANKEGLFQEVMWKQDENTILFGTVHNEIIIPDELISGSLEEWIVIIAPTAPVSETGFCVIRKKSSVVYTGRVLKDAAVSAASFFTKFVIDYTKFSKTEPLLK